MTYAGRPVPTPTGAGGRTSSGDRTGFVGLGLAVVGAAAVLCALTFLNWFTATGGSTPRDDDATFRTVHDGLTAIALTGTAKARFVPAQYFGWLAWTLLVVVTLAGVFACLPTGAAPVLRTMGPLLAVIAVALTFVAIDLVQVTDSAVAARSGDTLDYVTYLKQAGPAFYAAVGGFALLGVGARVGTRRDF